MPSVFARNYRFYRNGNFCKEIYVSNIISRAKVDARAVSLKSPLASLVCLYAKFAAFWHLAAEQNVNGYLFANIDLFFYWLA